MIGKEYFQAAAVADNREIDLLTSYVTNRPTKKRPWKKADLDPAPSKNTYPSNRLPPYHFLRTDLALLLGPSGSKLLNRMWAKFHLLTTENEPTRLRPALMKLFSVAARMAAPKGVGIALQRLVKDFERHYFQVVVDLQKQAEEKAARRFALLSVLQEGQGSHLLHNILGNSPSTDLTDAGLGRSYPSRSLGSESDQARRLFLFEAAYRAKSWSEAYRQARLLGESTKQGRTGRLARVCRGLSAQELPGSKKKQVLTDLAACNEETRSTRIDYALKAISFPTLSCRPGELEGLLCELLPPGDPWWRSSLSRFYRHKAVPHRWMRDIRQLWQTESSLRGLCRVLFSTLRYSKARAMTCLAKYQLDGRCIEFGGDVLKVRLEKVRDEVRQWHEFAPPCPNPAKLNGAVFKLSRSMWSTVSKLCGQLSVEVPAYGLTQFQSEPVRVARIDGRRVLSVSPEFLAADPREQTFFLARGLFRDAAGLAQLKQRMRPLSCPQALLERALDYADWCGHLQEPLEATRSSTKSEEGLIALEEMFWDTGDHNYRRLALPLHYGGWCPLFDREADLFAASKVEIVTATHALVRLELGPKALASEYTKLGLQDLFTKGDGHPQLCLRLQTLWITLSEQIQRNLR